MQALHLLIIRLQDFESFDCCANGASRFHFQYSIPRAPHASQNKGHTDYEGVINHREIRCPSPTSIGSHFSVHFEMDHFCTKHVVYIFLFYVPAWRLTVYILLTKWQFGVFVEVT